MMTSVRPECRVMLRRCLAIVVRKEGCQGDPGDFWMYESGYLLFQVRTRQISYFCDKKETLASTLFIHIRFIRHFTLNLFKTYSLSSACIVILYISTNAVAYLPTRFTVYSHHQSTRQAAAESGDLHQSLQKYLNSQRIFFIAVGVKFTDCRFYFRPSEITRRQVESMGDRLANLPPQKPQKHTHEDRIFSELVCS